MNITEYDETETQQCCCPGREEIPILLQHWCGYSQSLGLSSKLDRIKVALSSPLSYPEGDGLSKPSTADVILPDTEGSGGSYLVSEPGPEVPEKQGDRHEVVEVEDDAQSVRCLLFNEECPQSESVNHLESVTITSRRLN